MSMQAGSSPAGRCRDGRKVGKTPAAPEDVTQYHQEGPQEDLLQQDNNTHSRILSAWLTPEYKRQDDDACCQEHICPDSEKKLPHELKLGARQEPLFHCLGCISVLAYACTNNNNS